VQEGHQVPSQLPLSKGEEKILKKIRRKIKNKVIFFSIVKKTWVITNISHGELINNA